MSTQIEIGVEVAEFARDEIAAGKDPASPFYDLLQQCLQRDVGWKAFYSEKMDTVQTNGANQLLLDIYSAELAAEKAFMSGRPCAGDASHPKASR